MSRDQNAGRSHTILIEDSFERVEQFKNLRRILKNHSSIQEESKCRLKSQYDCYHSAQNTIYDTAL